MELLYSSHLCIIVGVPNDMKNVIVPLKSERVQVLHLVSLAPRKLSANINGTEPSKILVSYPHIIVLEGVYHRKS